MEQQRASAFPLASSHRAIWRTRSTALGGARVLAVGDGAQRYDAVLAAVNGVEVVSPGLGFPPPAVLLRLAIANLLAGKSPDEPASVVPLYIREADARSNFARADRS